MASVSGGYLALAGREKGEREGNAKAQSVREEDGKDCVVACRGMGIFPMIPTGGTTACRRRGGRVSHGGGLFFSP